MQAEVQAAGWAGAPGWLVLPEPPGPTPVRELVAQALVQADLLKGTPRPDAVVLASGSRRLTVRELRSLAEALSDAGIALAGVCSRAASTRVAAAALGLPIHAGLPAPATQGTTAPQPLAPGQPLHLHRGTLRAGDHLEAPGSLLVLGDVNPGARVSAAGHVLVWGRLRGTAHAGCQGDQSARIVALQLRPLQLRIGDAVARGPEDRPPAGLAEQAVLNGGEIRLEPADPIWPLSD